MSHDRRADFVRPNVRPDADNPGLGGSAEPVAPPRLVENLARRLCQLAHLELENRFAALECVPPEERARWEQNARALLAEFGVARAPQGDPPSSDECAFCGAALCRGIQLVTLCVSCASASDSERIKHVVALHAKNTP